MIVKTQKISMQGSKTYKYPYIRLPANHSLAKEEEVKLILDFICIIVPSSWKNEEIKKHLKIIMEKL